MSAAISYPSLDTLLFRRFVLLVRRAYTKSPVQAIATALYNILCDAFMSFFMSSGFKTTVQYFV